MFSRRDNSEPATVEHPCISHGPVVNVPLHLALAFETVELEHATAGHDVRSSGKDLSKEAFTTRIRAA